jgi:hypothetical protein
MPPLDARTAYACGAKRYVWGSPRRTRIIERRSGKYQLLLLAWTALALVREHATHI